MLSHRNWLRKAACRLSTALEAARRRVPAHVRKLVRASNQKNASTEADFSQRAEDAGPEGLDIEAALAAGLAQGDWADEGIDGSEDDEDWADDWDEEQDDGTPVVQRPVVVVAGFFLEELAGVRALLDQAGGQDIAVIPSTPSLLQAPLEYVLGIEEPAWDQPMPQAWVHGGGWGMQRMVLMAGLGLRAQAAVIEHLLNSRMGTMAFTSAAREDLCRPLGEVLARGLQNQRALRAGATDFSQEGSLAALEGELRQGLVRQAGGSDKDLAQAARLIEEELRGLVGSNGAGDADAAGPQPAQATPAAEPSPTTTTPLRAEATALPQQTAAPAPAPQPAFEQEPVGASVAPGSRSAGDAAGLDLIDRVAAGEVLGPEELLAGAAAPRPGNLPADMVDPVLRVFTMLDNSNAAEEGAEMGQQRVGGLDADGGADEGPELGDFVLNRAQLRAITDKYGLDYGALLEGMQAQGLELDEDGPLL